MRPPDPGDGRLPPHGTVRLPLEPLIDVLVHGQDVVVPLGRTRPVPPAAAAAAATRAWSLRLLFGAQRRLPRLRLSATDTDWRVGTGAPVEGPMSALLLLATGRTAAVDQLSGEGAARLVAHRNGDTTRSSGWRGAWSSTSRRRVEVYDAVHAALLRRTGGVVEGLLVHLARGTDAGFQVIQLWEFR